MILGFQNRFVLAVKEGTKPHTIRTGTRWREGMSIQFYQNVRQKAMAKIREDAEAKVVQEVRLLNTGQYDAHIPNRRPWLFIDGRLLSPLECEELSVRDGFENFFQLVVWFAQNHTLPFTGQLVCWTDLRY